MKNRLNILFTILPVIVFLLSASNNFVSGQNKCHSLHFRISDSHLDENWLDNLNQIRSIQEFLDHNAPSKIEVLSASSPDGPYSLNKKLSVDRAQATVNLIKRICPSLPDSVFVVKSIFEDIDGTVKLLMESGQPLAQEAISLLRKGGSDPEEALRHYKDGIVWRYLADNVYPLLRRSEITFIYDINGVSAGLIPVGSSSETVNNQSNTTGKVPGWAIPVMAFLAAAAVVFGVLYARERKRTRVLINNSKDNLQVENVHVDIPEPHEEPVIFPSQEAPVMPLAASAMALEPSSSPAEEASFLGQVKAKIQENIADSGFGVEELASAMGMSRIHLNRKLKTEAESSPSVLLKEARMALAARLLKEGTKSIAEISTLSGFSTPSYFATAFKDFYNISPSEYISQN
ncbi:MAG: helix-turn-helix transcriptional regulator [Bacteroidales bacterium]|nr:helix-turn-helix transcriptional regulator [Bacteroidales bacterium]